MLPVRRSTVRANSSIVISRLLPTLNVSPIAAGVAINRVTAVTASRTSVKQRVCWPSP